MLLDCRGDKIVNYPKQHMANFTTKHGGTGNRLKPNIPRGRPTRSLGSAIEAMLVSVTSADAIVCR